MVARECVISSDISLVPSPAAVSGPFYSATTQNLSPPIQPSLPRPVSTTMLPWIHVWTFYPDGLGEAGYWSITTGRLSTLHFIASLIFWQGSDQSGELTLAMRAGRGQGSKPDSRDCELSTANRLWPLRAEHEWRPVIATPPFLYHDTRCPASVVIRIVQSNGKLRPWNGWLSRSWLCQLYRSRAPADSVWRTS